MKEDGTGSQSDDTLDESIARDASLDLTCLGIHMRIHMREPLESTLATSW